MMKLGVCTAFENIHDAAKLGYDFIECNLSLLAAMEEEAFKTLCEQAKSFPVPVRNCNGFLPGDLKVTGPDWNEDVIRAYLDRALSRAAAIGIETAVFGSGAARNVPEGWPFEKAWKQLAAFLTIASEYCEKYGVKIAIEPLRRQECNIVNLVSEALVLASWVDSPYIGVLGDTFHLLSVHEPWTALGNAGEKLMHVHISSPLQDMSGRVYPFEGDGHDYSEIFDVLKKMEYTGGVSVEAGTGNFVEDAAKAKCCLDKGMCQTGMENML